MKNSIKYKCIKVVTCIVFFVTSSFLTYGDTQKINSNQTKAINEQIKEIDKNLHTISKYSKSTQELAAIKKAEEAGLSNIIKAISPEGGRFEIQPNGVIKIIPNDPSIIKKLLRKSKPSSAGSSSKRFSPKTISKNSKEIIEHLRKANNQGLSSLLNKLATDGGAFELIENGGIKIIPANAAKAKKINKASSATNTLIINQKDLDRLSKKLGSFSSSTKSWVKVRDIARTWIKNQNRPRLVVGKIRHIKWLYVVSIVTDKGKMDTQLVVRANDGKTVAFTQNTFEVIN